MIEKSFVAQKIKEYLIQNFISEEIGKGKYTHCEIKKTPLGEKIIIYTSKPGQIVGKKGEVIRGLTDALKNKFKMENPQIEVAEIEKPEFNAQNVAEQIVNTLERFGPKRFKSIGYKMIQKVIDAGALGVEVIISGRGVPGARAKSWRFYAGYLKKCGEVSQSFVKKGFCVANLQSGSIGVKVSIMTPDTLLPDKIELKGEKEEEKKIEIKEKKEAEPEKKEEPVKEEVAKKIEEEKVIKKITKKKVETKKRVRSRQPNKTQAKKGKDGKAKKK